MEGHSLADTLTPEQFFEQTKGRPSPLEVSEPSLEPTLREAVRQRAAFKDRRSDLWAYRDKVWGEVQSLAASLASEQTAWAQSLSPAMIGHSHLHQPLMRELGKLTESPDQHYADDLTEGFRLHGRLPEYGWWGRGCTESVHHLVSPAQLYKEAARRGGCARRLRFELVFWQG